LILSEMVFLFLSLQRSFKLTEESFNNQSDFCDFQL
jgi:hypothetical protein